DALKGVRKTGRSGGTGSGSGTGEWFRPRVVALLRRRSASCRQDEKKERTGDPGKALHRQTNRAPAAGGPCRTPARAGPLSSGRIELAADLQRDLVADARYPIGHPIVAALDRAGRREADRIGSGHIV